ncbi:predicted protein [Phaeodactylum tricornutum CCAP 1055/1]|jgi:HSP20 family molecular chaperone IbpA|uniref:SHSP domain-containing protein n=1 Tax=Phaeodactylum tricornutum (strain CCAP 1055/1) TaxID=556484 RepID=B7G194_PHATC|nr:predicted protein [Phaeodactylum tricornutum CCAP 1055/1]EEC47465.1 predicted protein [Phaeodactylum tricornutum CCAP 1055/1]|eukprot:XP_002180813.1 predicted protein [Phaeodactylum tricornutum CCAP 1055/1]
MKLSYVTSLPAMTSACNTGQYRMGRSCMNGSNSIRNCARRHHCGGNRHGWGHACRNGVVHEDAAEKLLVSSWGPRSLGHHNCAPGIGPHEGQQDTKMCFGQGHPGSQKGQGWNFWQSSSTTQGQVLSPAQGRGRRQGLGMGWRSTEESQPCELRNMVGQSSHAPLVDIVTDDDHVFQIAFDLPYAKPSDIEISVNRQDRVLTVSGMRQIGFGSETSMIPFLERISIDSWISMDRFSAKLSNGLLLVTAPKEFDAKDSFVQKISIQDVDTKEQATD